MKEGRKDCRINAVLAEWSQDTPYGVYCPVFKSSNIESIDIGLYKIKPNKTTLVFCNELTEVMFNTVLGGEILFAQYKFDEFEKIAGVNPKEFLDDASVSIMEKFSDENFYKCEAGFAFTTASDLVAIVLTMNDSEALIKQTIIKKKSGTFTMRNMNGHIDE